MKDLQANMQYYYLAGQYAYTVGLKDPNSFPLPIFSIPTNRSSGRARFNCLVYDIPLAFLLPLSKWMWPAPAEHANDPDSPLPQPI